MSSATTLTSRPSRSRRAEARLPVDPHGLERHAPLARSGRRTPRAPGRSPAAPSIGCGIERARPPPSPTRTASAASIATRPVEVALAGGGEEARGETVALGGVGVEARAVVRDRRRARLRIWRQLSSLRSTIAAISANGEVERRRAGRAPRARPATGARAGRGTRARRSPRSRRATAPRLDERLGQPRPDVGLAPYARRAQHVDREPRGDRRQERALRVDRRRRDARRRNASCTTSSASATLPSIR